MRYVYPILGLLILVAGLGGIKVAQISSLVQMGKAMEAAGPPPEAVSTAIAEELAWEGTLSSIGSVVAEQGVVVSAEVPGTVSRLAFESGDTVKKGQVLLELDSSVERAQLATARSRRDLAASTAERTRALAKSQTVTEAKLEADEAALAASEAEVSALKAQIDRKVVRAAFSGKLGIRAVNLGQYLAPGTQLTTLEALDSVFVDFSLPQQALPELKNDMPVRLRGTEQSGKQDTVLEGRISAISPSVDERTRSIQVRAAVSNENEVLRPGMFVEVDVVLPSRGSVVAIPQTAVTHASYGDSVFVIEPAKDAPADPKGPPVKLARQQFVRLGEARGDYVAVLEGVKAGQEVVSAGAFKLRNNAKVVVNDRVKSDVKVNPKPENR